MRIPKQLLHHPSQLATTPGFRLPRWQRRAWYGVVALLVATGLAWLAAHYFLRPVSEFGAVIHPLEPWSMKLHGAAAMVSLWLAGSLLHVHIRRALAVGRNLLAGWLMIAWLGALALTGYGLYYVAGEDSRPWWSGVHWVLGLLLPLLLLLHVVTGRRSVRRRHAA
ncbi:MAG: DUF4405 domain-containing protein [Herminiimonas sp.]|nr:DUF4405 domain-containing protein [Herminiimonas sp.]